MRNIIIVLIFSCVLFACDDFLKTEPSDFLTVENYYETEQQLDAALIGVYSTLNSPYLYNNYMLARMGLEADEGFCSNVNELNVIGGYNVSTSDIKVTAYWQTLYQGINRANILLENIHKPQMDSIQRDRIKGETLFLRAYFYFMLVEKFGDVPLTLKSAKTESIQSLQLHRTPKEEVYQQILKDMEEASHLVKDIRDIGFGGQVSQSAVWGIMARVCLYMAGNPVNDVTKYADAKKYAEKVINSGIHTLNPSYIDVFKNYALDKYDIKESIFEVEMWGNNTTAITNGGLVGVANGIRQNTDGDPTIGYSNALLHPTFWLFNIYEASGVDYSNDSRRDWTISPYYYQSHKTNIKVYWTDKNIYNRFCGKWRRETETLMPKTGRSPQNFVLLRYSDVLLMFAEAENELNGPTDSALLAVNTVRRRAYGKYLNGPSGVSESVASIKLVNGGTGYTSVPTVTISGGGGVDATAKATISGGKVTSITILNSGNKFTSIPTVTISGGGGSGASATATLTNLTDADVPSANKTDKDAFRLFIRDERARELAFELLRKGDLVRWGIFMERMTFNKNHATTSPQQWSDTKNAIVYFTNASQRDVVWPIPSYERSVNSNLEQNEGW